MAGMAFANAFLGVMHSMAHKLGAFHHIPHGVANALMMDEVIRFNSAEVPTKMGTFPQYGYPHTAERYAEIADYLGVKGKMKPLVAAKPDCVICMSCGDGVQCVAKNAPGIPTYPSNNTMYLGEAVRFGVWEEACHFCGDCVLGQTGGICPVTQCAKSLVNGPCGGQKNGKCEVNPENDCAWIKIYKRLEEIGQLDKLGHTREDKGYAKFSYPRTISLKGKK